MHIKKTDELVPRSNTNTTRTTQPQAYVGDAVNHLVQAATRLLERQKRIDARREHLMKNPPQETASQTKPRTGSF